MIERFETKKEFSRAVIRNGLVYFTGILAYEKYPTIQEQTESLCKRLDYFLEKYGSNKDNILISTAYIAKQSLRPGFDEVWGNWMKEGHSPTRVCVGVQLTEGHLIELHMVAELVESNN